MTHDAILFDLDGTLLNTLEDLADSMNVALARLGCPAQPVDDYRYHVGDGVRKLTLRALRAAGGDRSHVDTAIDAMRAEYLKRWSNKTKLYEGVPELLDNLRGRGVPMAILSNKPDSFTQLVVEHFFDPDCFAVVRGARDSVARKPDPAGALAIADEMGIAPPRFLYVGDTNTDMRTAAAARMYPAGALWGFRTEQELRSSGAAVVLARPADVLDCL